jgi:predicted nucleic acid-binding protein
MEYVSSDTNVWIDFSIIGCLELPFLLPYTYIMNSDAIEDELLSPSVLRDDLLGHGLVGVEITIEEFNLAEKYGKQYLRLSKYDRIALAIAKARGICLLTGDGALRKAAMREKVKTIGTIGIFDQLMAGNYITEHEYKFYLQQLLKHNGREIRLPKSEINLRLQRLK